MRTDDHGDDACFAHVQDGAATFKVNLWRWFLYSSADEFRKIGLVLNQSQGGMCICRVLGIGAGVSRECFGP